MVPAREAGVQVLGETTGQAEAVRTSRQLERRSWAIVWRASLELPPNTLRLSCGALVRPPLSLATGTYPAAAETVGAWSAASAG